MGSSNVGRRYNLPFRIEPDLGKVAKHSFKSQPNESCDVLNECVSWSKYAKDSLVFAPKSASLTVDAGHVPTVADVLAGESSTDNVNGFEIVTSALSDVSKTFRLREIL